MVNMTGTSNELSKTPYLLNSFKADEKKILDSTNSIKDQLKIIDEEISNIDKIIEDLKINKSLEEQGNKIKYKIETLLEEIHDSKLTSLDEDIAIIKNGITSLNIELKEKYNYETRLKEAENYINSNMAIIGNEFDFEASYKPINLKFSLESFDLYHEKPDKSPVYLRSMGSGANWLYCHLALFMSLQSYFCFLGKKCMIPPILFIDQPSQVYFPSRIDIKEEFDPKELKKFEGKENELDEDLKAVTNMYNQLIKHCQITKKETGIEPQIIITDHADNLQLEGTTKFEDIVATRRWRTRGFIQIDNLIPN